MEKVIPLTKDQIEVARAALDFIIKTYKLDEVQRGRSKRLIDEFDSGMMKTEINFEEATYIIDALYESRQAKEESGISSENAKTLTEYLNEKRKHL